MHQLRQLLFQEFNTDNYYNKISVIQPSIISLFHFNTRFPINQTFISPFFYTKLSVLF